MKNLFRRIKIAWLFTRNFPYTPLPQDYWLMEDARALSFFLTGSTGTKFRYILRNKLSDTALRAVIDTSPHTQHLCGFAAGVRSTIAEMDQLLDLANTPDGFGMEEEESLQTEA